MAVRQTICKTTGRKRFDAYVHLRSSRYPTIRIQKFQRCSSDAEARRIEKVLIRAAASELRDEENRGSHWNVVLHRWEAEAIKLKRNPTTLKSLGDHARESTVGTLKLWTKDWMNRPCKELSIKDGKDLLLNAAGEDLRPATIRKIKTYVNLVFRYGVQEGIIEGVMNSPVHGVPFDFEDGDALPEILSISEAAKLLEEARLRKHPWFAIWICALLTGMRSSELYALRKCNVHLAENIIRICESWDWKNDVAKSTKARYWRTAPIASVLKPVLEECMSLDPDDPFVFKRPAGWDRMEQAMIIRKFCEEIGLPSVRFHTLRACFATHLLILGVDTATIMAIGGWSNFKTFKIYIRLAGVTERHKTEELGKLLMDAGVNPTDQLSKVYRPSEMIRIA